MVIPRWGLMGAAVAAGLTELLLFGLFFQAINKNIGRIQFMSLLWRPVLAGAGMSFAIVKASWSLMPSFALGVGTYFILLMLLRTFNEFDFLVFRSILKREKDPLMNDN